MRSVTWTGAPILDACAIQARHGHLLVLTADGALTGINVEAGTVACLCTVELHELTAAHDGSHFGAPAHRLHASLDGQYAAVVTDHGRHGTVVDLGSGTVTMRLDGGNYHEDTVPFSACFARFEERNVFIHRSDWNRLDVADPATGRSLTDRHIAPWSSTSGRPEHYLDYFHGRLRLSPKGTRLFDDGWVWQPVAIPRVWSVQDWLGSNPWESEDGASIVELIYRDDWTIPACWINEQHLALWGLADWDEEEFSEAGQGPGVRIIDVTQDKRSPGERWPMEVHAGGVLELFSDGTRLYAATPTGTTVWDIASRTQLAELPGFTARLLHPARNSLVAFGAGQIAELAVP
ncbi:hypothetical protein DZC73_22330 [Albitalea terrae]|uniref:WD40 repeat domain-containing protein n=2 Tax=Piscinibacter terrae TaxID=2496871 RepID=A0A3N7HJZ7_9BURK|nr:hypothetical protein DZC73_22330 [Albitalea terrae]